MTSLGKRRRCGCDARDEGAYIPDETVPNPLFCSVCGASGDQKPPCKYTAHFECRVFLNTAVIAEAEVVLRVLCAWKDVCKFVSGYPFLSSTALLSDAATPTQDACTWEGRYRNGIGLADAYQRVEWELDIAATPVTFTHRSGIQYAVPEGEVFDCYNPNTLRLIATSPLAKGVPDSVCIVPAVKTAYPEAQCCQNCFRLTFADMLQVPGDWSTAGIPAQVITFLPITTTSFQGYFTLPKRTCSYAARMIDIPDRQPSDFGNTGGSISRLSTAYLACQNEMSGGLPSPAQLIIEHQTGQSGSEPIKRALFECASFSCEGGRFWPVNQNALSAPYPAYFDIVASDFCVQSEYGGEGRCPAPGGGSAAEYSTEEDRFMSCDRFCACIPGEMQILQAGSGRRCGMSSGSSLGFCIADSVAWDTGVDTPRGPSRSLCCVTPNFEDICATIYFGGSGKWLVDWYCDGVFAETTDLEVTSCCPLKGFAPMPALPCTDATGCIGVNMAADCSMVARCCDSADETTCFLTLSSDCPALDGLSIEMTGAGAHVWSGTTLSNELDVMMTCSGGTYTVSFTYGDPLCTISSLTSTDAGCAPAMHGSFAGGVVSGCFLSLGCLDSATVTAELSP